MPASMRDMLLPAVTESAAHSETIKFWVGSDFNYQGGGKPVGCGSFLLQVDTGIARSADIEGDLQIALEALFNPARTHPAVETFDWIKQLELGIESLSFREGAAQVQLSGTLLGIGSCGDAILEAQILQTIFQFDVVGYAYVSDGVTNLWEIVDQSGRLRPEQRRHWVYERP